ncbi:hypothetical protein BSKO_08295 [Bryopsis sp. KO-2023]|nr:hypothetical protein BSKO_08295 [Bryopsis sp. KO-2023]
MAAKGEEDKTVLSSDFKRLQKIEERILSCVELAGRLAETLSHIGKANPEDAIAACKTFVDNVQTAQECIMEALEEHKGDRDFEVTVYPYVGKTYVLEEKVGIFQKYITQMEKSLKDL